MSTALVPAHAPHRLISLAQLRVLDQRSDRLGAIQILGHLGLIALTGTGVFCAGFSFWLLPTLLLHGIAQVALFAPLHECSHRTAFRHAGLNRAVAWLAGLILVLPPTWFRQFHLAHHRYTQCPERDPELASPKPQSLRHYLWLLSGVPYWQAALVGLVRQAAGQLDDLDYLPKRLHPQVIVQARLFLAVYTSLVAHALLTWTSAPLIYWLIPLLLGQPCLRWFLLPEHTGCNQSNDGLTNTRTVLANAGLRWLNWNMSYHTEHHLYPSVPFHALPALHQLLRARLRVVADSYAGAHRDIRQSWCQ
ncbi:fatty acid desaturase [Leptolyngbya sp. FACHB-261]|uniref:fatty acid desaturase n=1 Tax=Leptolyngbya sp. FACHB-261 TaxID=2692806 RepID=UPI00168820DF|nr:fatty acid desaturase [Leptolyngbya sp. FACHB-261]MBD2104561.1 fatty acid desaturase [Leptolyngbya sp. FACHB-261]